MIQVSQAVQAELAASMEDVPIIPGVSSELTAAYFCLFSDGGPRGRNYEPVGEAASELFWQHSLQVSGGELKVQVPRSADSNGDAVGSSCEPSEGMPVSFRVKGSGEHGTVVPGHALGTSVSAQTDDGTVQKVLLGRTRNQLKC